MLDVSTKLDRLRADHAKALEKATEWQARAKELEKQIMEIENSEILRVVRGVTATPEELFGLLTMLRASRETPDPKPENNTEIGGIEIE